MTLKDELINFLQKNKDENNAAFERKLISTNYEILGLKTKLIEDYAKMLAKENADISLFLPFKYYEEILIAGIMIGKRKISAKEKVGQIRQLLPFIDNWGTCDCILSRLKNMESEKEFFFSLLNEKNPFYQRFGVVWILKYYLKIDVKHSLFLIKNTKNDNYYLKMAKSWAYAEAFVYDFELTKLTLTQDESDIFVVKKSLQKALESYRISDKQKSALKKIRE